MAYRGIGKERNMSNLLYELEKARQDLNTSMQMLRKNGEELAQAESEYQVIKAQTVLMMKQDGCSITEIGLSIKGQPEVAKAMLKRDIAKTMYEANQEHINVKKLDIRVIENQIAREWNNG